MRTVEWSFRFQFQGRNSFVLFMGNHVEIHFRWHSYQSFGKRNDRVWKSIKTKKINLSKWIYRIFSDFNTMIDVKLQEWTDRELPSQCVTLGHRVLLDEFQNLIEQEQNKSSNDPIANNLKNHLVQTCRSQHRWDSKALDSLVNPITLFSFFLEFRLSPGSVFYEETCAQLLRETKRKILNNGIHFRQFDRG